MPSLKSIIEGGPVRTVRFDWGGDEIVMRVKTSGITVREMVEIDLGEQGEEVSQVEQARRTQEFIRDMARVLERCLVEWNMWLDDEETQMMQTYEHMLELPGEFLMLARNALQSKVEDDASGETSAGFAAG